MRRAAASREIRIAGLELQTIGRKVNMYTDRRNYGCRLTTDLLYKGYRAIVLENELLEVTVLADKGTDITEFLYKPTDTDFMFRSPLGLRPAGLFVPTSSPTFGAFGDRWQGGWPEIFPAGGPPSNYKGAEFGQHGEVATIPWEFQVVEDTPRRVAVRFWVRTYRTPFLLEKTLWLESGKAVLGVDEKATNDGAEEMHLMWGHHPTFGPPFLDDRCRVDVPAQRLLSAPGIPISRVSPGAELPWPIAPGKDDQPVDLRQVAPPESHLNDMLFLTDLTEGWYGITNIEKKVGFGMAWDPSLFKYVWYWLEARGSYGYPFYGKVYAMALEPWTSHVIWGASMPGLAAAVNNGTAIKLGAGESLETSLVAVAYAGLDKVSRIERDGTVS